tara:strand:+ start:2621 stop:3907 length:1287 start_codon:yes stop_codon:yes gene_type:complete
MALIDLKTNLAKRIEYDRKDLSTERVNSAESNYDKFKSDDGQFIQKDVGERYRNTNADGGLFRGGIALQAERTLEDARRVGKFLGTSKGKIFTLKQFYLQARNASKNTRIYNPLSLLASLPNNISQQRHVNTGNGSLGGFLGGLIGFPSKGKSGKGAVTLFSKDRKGKLQVSYDGASINTQGQLGKLNANGDKLPKDFIKFRIRDAVNGKWIIFPALISGITDNSSAETTPIQYIGRPDKVYVYGGTDRTIGFNMKVVALNEGDITTIWEKMNYLKGLVHPQYKEFKNDSGESVGLGTRPVAPIIYLTIGDMFVNTPGFFKSINITVPENTNWETKDGLQFPHVCDVSFDFQYIGKETPTMLSKNYEGKVGEKVLDDRQARAVATEKAKKEAEKKATEQKALSPGGDPADAVRGLDDGAALPNIPGAI